MKTAAKVLVFLTILLAHKALVAQDNTDINFDSLVEKVNHSLTSWVTYTPRS